MNTYFDDILTQPRELSQALDFYASPAFRQTLESAGRLRFQELIWSGMGSSHFCSFPANVHLAAHGVRSQVISAGELLHYEAGRIRPDTLLCLISQSGESAEIVRLLEPLSPDVPVIAITNDPDSTLGKRGKFVFPLRVSGEKSVTTRTYLASVIITTLLAFAVTGEDLDRAYASFRKVLSQMTAFLSGTETVSRQLGAFGSGVSCLSVMGRGPALTTARAGALFFREVARIAAMDFDSAEFRHGPMEMVEKGFFSVVLAPAGKTQELSLRLAEDVSSRGGKAVLITDAAARPLAPETASGILRLDLPETDELTAPFLQILPIQLLADLLAKERGICAGEFRWGGKITAIE